MKKYLICVKGKDNTYIECNDMEDVEEKLFNLSTRIFNFEVYHIIDDKDVVKLVELSLKRVKKSIQGR